MSDTIDRPWVGSRPGRGLGPLLMAAFLCACGAADAPDHGRMPHTTWEAAFSSLGAVELEENDDVVNAYPRVAVDPRGGYLVADMYEHQARRYAEDGRLLFRFGREGSGPGEFVNPTAIARVASGEILVADMWGRISVFDSTGDAFLRSKQAVHTAVLQDIDLLDDTLAVLSTGPRPGEPRLHLWDLRRDTTVAAFFVPYVAERNLPAAAAMSWTSAAIRGDTIAATFSLSDTVYLFDRSGREVERIPLPNGRLTSIDDVPTNYRPGDGVAALSRWLSAVDAVRKIEWLADGTFIVEYVSGSDETFHSSLLGMTRQGRLIFALEDTPRLLATTPDGKVIFQSPSSDLPNHWSIVRPRW
jgi:hypothetical protein